MRAVHRLVLGLILSACTGAPAASTVAGRVAEGGALAALATLEATDEAGHTTRAPITGGRFRLTLPTPATYAFALAGEGARVRVLLPRRNRFDAAFILAAEGAEVSLGEIVALPPDATLRFVPSTSADAAACGVASGVDLCVVEEAAQLCPTAPAPDPTTACTVDLAMSFGDARALPGIGAGVPYAVALGVPPCAVSDCTPPRPST